MMPRLFCAIVLAMALAAGCDKSKGGSGPATPAIAVIPKSTDHPYWKAVQVGADKGAKEAGVEIWWNGPNTEADRGAQIRIVADLLDKGAEAICIAPNDKDALVNTIVQAHQRVPVIVYDSGANTEDYTAFIATDNRRGGEMAGEAMLKLLGDAGGKVAVVRGIAGSESTTEREEGFIAAVKKNPNVKLIDDLRGDNAELKSRQATADLLAREGDIAGFFGPSEPVCKGILGALNDAGKGGKVKFIGFDGGDELAKGMDDHQIDALVVQRPVLMGELAVKAAVAAIHHLPVQKVQRIDPMLITQQNKDQPDVRELLQPRIR